MRYENREYVAWIAIAIAMAMAYRILCFSILYFIAPTIGATSSLNCWWSKRMGFCLDIIRGEFFVGRCAEVLFVVFKVVYEHSRVYG